MTKKQQGAIIAIHGVGTPAPGDIVTQLTALPSPNGSNFFLRNDVVVDGTSFAAQMSEDGFAMGKPDTDGDKAPSGPDLFEVNWSDIKRPPRSIMGVAEWIISLSFAISRTDDLPWTGVRLLTARLRNILFEMLLLWVLFPVLLGLMHANLSGYGLAIGDSAVIGLALLTVRMTWKTTIPAKLGGVITLIVLGVLAIIFTCSPEKREFVNPLAVRAYGWTQVAADALIMLTAIEVFIRACFRNITVSGALARLAFAYLPLVMLSALGSCIWAITLNIIVRLGHRTDLDSPWQKMFVQNLGYDLKSVEWAMAFVTGALAFYVIAVVLTYGVFRQGFIARVAICGALILAPLLLCIPGILLMSPWLQMVWTWPSHLLQMVWTWLSHFSLYQFFAKLLPSSKSQDVLTVYTVSALRVLPWLAAVITPVATLLDVLADVVFYITDRNLKYDEAKPSAAGSQRAPFSSFEVCNKRLEQILDYAKDRYAWIHVVAHSQGSVIALEVLSASKWRPLNIKLTTIGSPLGPLYKRYLGWEIVPRANWKNLFRPGDYVGGRVGLDDVDQDIGPPGGHTGYWKDKKIAPRVYVNGPP